MKITINKSKNIILAKSLIKEGVILVATQRGLYKMYIADEVTIRDLDDNYIAETDNVEMAFRIVDLLTEQDLVRIGSALIYAFEDSEYCLASYKGNHLRSIKTVHELLKWYGE